MTWSWYLPTGQWSQLVAPVHAEKLPLAQLKHEPDVDGWNLPIEQLVQWTEPSMAYMPLLQVTQAAWLNVSEY